MTGKLAVVLSRTSRGGFAWVAASAALAPADSRVRRAAETAAVAWTADGVALALSHLIGRDRPCRRGGSLVPCPDSPSFPSNHAATAAAAAATIAARDGRYAVPAALAAAAVAAARVRVGVHHRADVVAGLALGAAIARGARAVTR